MALLLPTWLELDGWAGVFFAALVLIGLGRLLTAGRAAPEAALIAGWGGAALVLTLWGALTPLALRGPAIALAALGLGVQLIPRLRVSRAEWRSVLRLLILALPLFAIMASARPSQPDTWLNLLPNAAYLYDHNFFPADARPPAHSYIAGAPYNLQLAAYIAGLVTSDFPSNAMIGLNFLLLLACGLLLARLVAQGEEQVQIPPSWGATALGLLLATALNPGFVPRYHLTVYSETSVTVTLAFAGWFAARALDRLAAARPAGWDFWLLSLSLAALVNIKQESVALVVAVLVSAALLAVLSRSSASRALIALVVASLPAAALYLVWRWYVLTHFALGELKPMPMAQWPIAALPLILWKMLLVAAGKLVFFGALALAFVALWAKLRRNGLSPATRATAMLGGIFLLYNLVLIFAYVALFPATMGTEAHSYFRYNTHLSLLLMVSVVLLARDVGSSVPRRVPKFAPAVCILLALLSPIAFLRFLRFDLEVPELRGWTLAKETASAIGDHDRLMLILPGDNGSVATMLEGVLRLTAPRRPEIELAETRSLAPDSFATLDAQGYRLALLSCAPAGLPGVPAGSAALFARAEAGWRVAQVWPYAPVPRGARWSQILAPLALCLGG